MYYGGVEFVEEVFVDEGVYGGVDVVGARGFVEDDEFVCVLKIGLDGFLIYGFYVCEFDEVGVDVFGVEFCDGFFGFFDVVEVGDDGDGFVVFDGFVVC